MDVTDSTFCNNLPRDIHGPVNLTNVSGCPAKDTCPADIDDNGVVGINDFLDLLAAWGPCP